MTLAWSNHCLVPVCVCACPVLDWTAKHLHATPLDKWLRPERLGAPCWCLPLVIGHSHLAASECSLLCGLGVIVANGFERQICIGKHLVKYFSKSIYQGEMEECASPKVEGSCGREQERRWEWNTKTYAFQLPWLILEPRSSGGGGAKLCRLQCGSERFMPCTLNTYRQLSTAQFWKGDYGSDMKKYFIWNCWKISGY